MSEIGPSCSSAQNSFIQSCLPSNYDRSALDGLLNNFGSGICAGHLTNMFFNCLPTHEVSRWNGTCTTSYGAFKDCLPGAYAHLSEQPSRCALASWTVFGMNEAMGLTKNPKVKLMWSAAVQAARSLESYFCLPKCRESSDTFVFMGPKETKIELSRYKRGVVKHILSLESWLSWIPGYGMASNAWSWFSEQPGNGLGALHIAITHPLLWDILPGLQQQGMRNQDFMDVYRKCVPVTYYVRQFTKTFDLTKLPAALCHVLWDNLISPLLHFSTNLVKQSAAYALGKVSEGIQVASRAILSMGHRAFASFYTNFIEGNQFLEFLGYMLSSAVSGVGYGGREVYNFLRVQIESLFDSLCKNWEASKKARAKAHNLYLNKPKIKVRDKSSILKEMFVNVSASTYHTLGQLIHGSEDLTAEQVEETKKRIRGYFDSIYYILFGAEPENQYLLS